MKRLTFLIMMLATVFSSIHAQESAFEELLPYRVDWLNASFCRETTDDHFIVAPGAECRVLKISQEGKVVDEMTYRMDTVNNFWTWFGQLIDIPNDPSHYLAIAEMYDDIKECHNLFHIVKIDENLYYDPDEVIVVDLSEEVRHFWIESDPHFVIDGEGNLSFATVAKKWDDTYCLMYVKVTPEGEKTIVYDPSTNFVNGGEVCAFVPRGDHYMMMAGFSRNDGPYSTQYICHYEVSLDFVSDSICLLNGQSGVLSYDNLQDSCFFANWDEGVSGFTPVLLEDGDYLLPARVYGISHYDPSGEHNGVGLWKLNANGDVLKRVFMDVYDVNSSGMNLEYFYNTQNPLLVHGNDVYLIYSPRGLGFTGTPLRTVICKFDTDLNLIWKRWYGEAFGRGVATGATLTSDGGCLISGYGGPQAPYTADAYVLKITSDGYCSVKENEEPPLRPYCFFPNPVDDQLHMEFSPDVTPKQVELYDLQGRLVSIQNNGFENVETGQLPSGAYTMRIIMEDGTNYSDKLVKQ